MTGAVVRFPPRASMAVVVCPEREGEGWLTIAGAHGWLCGSVDEARATARWLSGNLGGLPVREEVA
jgi:hypothetical protein